ncbi:MAG TPA: hypothetical protein VJU61_12760, partial [Polyangiaceae bacterium]|nr:hypothetical protein [Polyangiaceae bacterium]
IDTHRVCKPGCILSLTTGIGLLGVGLAGQVASKNAEEGSDERRQANGYQTVGYTLGSVLTGLGLLLFLVSEEPVTDARGIVPYLTATSAGVTGRF